MEDLYFLQNIYNSQGIQSLEAVAYVVQLVAGG